MMMRRRARSANPNSDENIDDLKNHPTQWRRMIGYLAPYKVRLAFAFVALIFSAGLSLVFPSVIGQVVDSVLTAGNYELLNQITLALIGVFLLRSFTTLIESFNLNYVGENMVTDLRTEVFTHLNQLSMGFFTSRRVGELVSRISSDVTTMRTVLTNNLNTLLQQSLILIGSLILMLSLNWRLSLFIVVLIPIIAVAGFGFGRYVRKLSTQVQDEIADSTVVTEETFQNIREVKSFVREGFEVGRYVAAVRSALKTAITLARLNSIFGALMSFLAFGSLAAFLWFGGREVLENRLTGGELITFLFYGVTVAGSFFSLVGIYTQFQSALGATKRVFQILDTQPDVKDAPNATAIRQAEGRITLDGVSFSYEGDHGVLHDITLDIAPGEIVALVGPSGAGKTTLFNLIPRFYDPSAGTIKMDGQDLRALTQASVRSQVGIVPQETLLFGGTIRENILYGRLEASEAEIIEAAKAANAHDFIISLPNQYETVVGERGIKLSGGQRQRVAIARAILKDPRILLLDEATSSLDSESEYLVQEALARLMQNRTTVIIAHRLSTVRVANRIVVLEDGRVVEIGTHDELIVNGGLYSRLYERQFALSEGAA